MPSSERTSRVTSTAIEGFFGDFRFLSNFYPSPIDLWGMRFPTAEHAYAASKTLAAPVRAEIANLATPLEAKRYFDASNRRELIRPDWGLVRVAAMVRVITSKFALNDELGGRLCATAPRALIEVNNWGDRYWGVDGTGGFNLLGQSLVLVRTALLASRSSNARPLEPLQASEDHHPH